MSALPGVCPETGKSSHTTRKDAEAHLKQLVWMNQSRGETARSAGLNVYPCDRCDGWHVGHQHSIAIVWHYTPKTFADRIVSSGKLRPRRPEKLTTKQLLRVSPADRKRARQKWSEEAPLLWFSRREDWEPSVIKFRPSRPFPEGPPAGRCWDEINGEGLMRFGVLASVATLRWGDFLNRNRVSSDLRDAMTRRGDPTEWLATDRAVLVDECRRLEIYFRGAWVSADDLNDEDIDRYLDERATAYVEAWTNLMEKLGGAERISRELSLPTIPLSEPERILFEDLQQALNQRGSKWAGEADLAWWGQAWH